jgi:hypothetical protein
VYVLKWIWFCGYFPPGRGLVFISNFRAVCRSSLLTLSDPLQPGKMKKHPAHNTRAKSRPVNTDQTRNGYRLTLRGFAQKKKRTDRARLALCHVASREWKETCLLHNYYNGNSARRSCDETRLSSAARWPYDRSRAIAMKYPAPTVRDRGRGLRFVVCCLNCCQDPHVSRSVRGKVPFPICSAR